MSTLVTMQNVQMFDKGCGLSAAGSAPPSGRSNNDKSNMALPPMYLPKEVKKVAPNP